MENKEFTSADIWAMFAETNRRFMETDRKFMETDHKFAETRELFDKLDIKANNRSAELDRKFAETRELFDKLGIKADNINTRVEGIAKSNGLFAEEYFFNSLGQNMEFAGIHFNDISYGEVFKRRKDMPDGSRLEDQFDIVMRNGSAVAIIEIKYKADSDHVKDIATRKVKNFRILFPEYKDFGIYLGLGSFSFNRYVINKAKEYGVGLLKQVGETVEYKTDWKLKMY
jgi:hypothetical protein